MGLFDKKQQTAQKQPQGEIPEVYQKLIDALKLLRDAGILTYDEYSEKKQKVYDMI